MSADGTLGERPVFNARAAVAAGIFYDWALNLRKQQLGACLTAKERLDASILYFRSPFAEKQSLGTNN